MIYDIFNNIVSLLVVNESTTLLIMHKLDNNFAENM